LEEDVGQKTHPIGFRLGVSKSWRSRWFARGKEYARLVHEDKWIRTYLKKKLYHAAISNIEIERASEKLKIIIHSARPGIVIGKKGAGIETLRLDLIKKFKKDVVVNIQEVRKAELDAQLVAENVAMQLERRVAFRRAMKKAVQSSLKMGAEGIRIQCSGRLGGAEIARSEWYREGRVPLHTLRADIDYGYAKATTGYGIIGVRSWVYRGDVTPS
jgi:small subunit ribosomal protein S3